MARRAREMQRGNGLMAVALESAAAAGWSVPPSVFSPPQRNSVSEGSTLRLACWRIRDALGLLPAHDAETRFRLRQRADGRSRPAWRAGTFRFAWGPLNYVHAGQLHSQFEEIFIRRQY